MYNKKDEVQNERGKLVIFSRNISIKICITYLIVTLYSTVDLPVSRYVEIDYRFCDDKSVLFWKEIVERICGNVASGGGVFIVCGDYRKVM